MMWQDVITSVSLGTKFKVVGGANFKTWELSWCKMWKAFIRFNDFLGAWVLNTGYRTQ